MVGPDVYELYPVVDTIAHEYSVGGDSATRSPLEWFQNQVGMYSFRAFAAAKAHLDAHLLLGREKAFSGRRSP